MRRAPPVRTIEYEWCTEDTEVESGDVGSCYFADTRAEAEAYTTDDPGRVMRVVLVRSVVVDGDRQEQSWAYVGPDGKLPERFSDSADLAFNLPPSGERVPQRFLAEKGKQSG